MAKRPIIMKALMKMPHGAHTHEEALEALKSGQPIVFPTDTLFGLGVSVLHAPSPDILYAIKHREKKSLSLGWWVVSKISNATARWFPISLLPWHVRFGLVRLPSL